MSCLFNIILSPWRRLPHPRRRPAADFGVSTVSVRRICHACLSIPPVLPCFDMAEVKDADRNPRTVPAPIDPMAYYFQDILLLNNPGAVRLYLIRHGESESNVARREGRMSDYDPPLTEVGRKHADRVGERMARYGVDAVYASPLQRAFDTGNEIARRLNMQVRVIDDLQEINEPLRQQGEVYDENL